MKPWCLAIILGLAGCGGRISEDPSNSSAGARGGTGGATSADDAAPSATAGCPILLPTSGQSCIASSGIPDDHFYCHYFLPGDTCATEVKCTQRDGSGEPAHFYTYGKSCAFPIADCVHGKACGSVFERDGACIVACTRACKCGPSGRLECKPIACDS
ncbi:MAG: hypothetical protein HYV09_32270 [Deltaproteobacteria bacterium]|nr:hypothetical protein [Deltaproteobacteria bacterium]